MQEKYLSQGKSDLVLLVPDLDGRASQVGGFADQLALRYPSATVFAAVNGSNETLCREAIKTASRRIYAKHSPFVNLAPSLRWAYGEILNSFSGVTVVRIDTAENPVELIAPVSDIAREFGGCIADPIFHEKTLRSGSADEHSQLDVFPTMFSVATRKRLALSGTHGFQAWKIDVLTSVYEAALLLWAKAATPKKDMPWGFDAAMALGAILAGVSPHVFQYSAIEVRDRPREKIANQFECVFRVVDAFTTTKALP